MQTENKQTEASAELIDLARRIHAWQDRMGIKTPALIREFRGIGSDKTFRDLRNGDLAAGYDVDQQLANYRAAWAEIEARDERAAEEPIYDDLSAVSEIRRAAIGAMRTIGSNRVVLAFGGSGIGKTSALRWLCAKYGSRIVPVEASVVWEDRPGELLGAILAASGAEGLPASAPARLAAVTKWLRKSRRMIAVDEAQHLGPRCLGTIKSLVNATPGEWLLLGIGTLRKRLDMDAYQEARQLTTNRLSEALRLGLTREDVARYLAHVFPAAAKADIKAGAAIVRDAAEDAGNMAYVRDAARQARDMTAEGESPTAQVWAEAVKAVNARR